ncbi:hypothetical protein [Belnapia rosea]|uniref:hypothetical protein n=1 Tax=Belnapia rosea TaxID=938405 RepID=UPI00088CAEE1|nr:hypothetical protein [Belnapia rosea]SDB75051.1 hypothetical protein SAMN02927895_05759 [Belnapia rosea]
MPSRKGKNHHRKSQASPESLALRPDTGLSFHEQDLAKEQVKRLMQSWQDKLPPKAKLSVAMKREVYAEVASLMSTYCRRLVSPEQVQLVAMTCKARKSKPTDFMLRLFERHHALVKAEAEAEGVYMRDITARALDAYFGLALLSR